jgi:molybdate transport system substrate-binding protein
MLAKFLRAVFFATTLANAAPTHASEITVSAASSLTDAFKEIGSSFKKNHPKTKVLLNFAASGTLLQQLSKGAPVDVIAFADLETMDIAEKQGLVKTSDRKIFAGNSMVVVTPKNSNLAVTELQDLIKPEFKRIAIGNPDSVPAGRYAKTALSGVGSWDAIKSKLIQTQNVRQALDYVARNEVEAGMVYATDAEILKDKVKVALDLKDEKNIAIKYPVAVTVNSKANDEARLFVAFVTSDSGQAILSKFGFKKP